MHVMMILTPQLKKAYWKYLAVYANLLLLFCSIWVISPVNSLYIYIYMYVCVYCLNCVHFGILVFIIALNLRCDLLFLSDAVGLLCSQPDHLNSQHSLISCWFTFSWKNMVISCILNNSMINYYKLFLSKALFVRDFWKRKSIFYAQHELLDVFSNLQRETWRKRNGVSLTNLFCW